MDFNGKFVGTVEIPRAPLQSIARFLTKPKSNQTPPRNPTKLHAITRNHTKARANPTKTHSTPWKALDTLPWTLRPRATRGSPNLPLGPAPQRRGGGGARRIDGFKKACLGVHGVDHGIKDDGLSLHRAPGVLGVLKPAHDLGFR